MESNIFKVRKANIRWASTTVKTGRTGDRGCSEETNSEKDLMESLVFSRLRS